LIPLGRGPNLLKTPKLESVVATSVPERKITVLLDRLNALLERTHEQPINELEWQRLRQDARHLLKTDAREARMALGILAALRGDEADAEREFKAAHALGWTPVLALNRATMLAQFHRVEDALDEVMTVVKQGPDGPFYLPALREAAEWAYAVGRLHLAADLLASLQKQTNDPLPEGLADLADTLNRLLPTADAISPKLREKPRPLGRGGIAHRAKRGQTPVDLTLMFLCEYNRQYENRTANQVAPG
jgi:hypothetical protein